MNYLPEHNTSVTLHISILRNLTLLLHMRELAKAVPHEQGARNWTPSAWPSIAICLNSRVNLKDKVIIVQVSHNKNRARLRRAVIRQSNKSAPLSKVLMTTFLARSLVCVVTPSAPASASASTQDVCAAGGDETRMTPVVTGPGTRVSWL